MKTKQIQNLVRQIAKLNWGHLIIDEGQDFQKIYIKFINVL